jgi:hypothetical protein
MHVRTLAIIAFVTLALAAHADEKHRESAVEIFAHGRALAAAGRCAEAIPFFLDTLKIEQSVGALLNLAECHEKLGTLGEAYRRYREAERLAHESADDREALARSRAASLEPRLPKLTVVAPPNVQVTVDGARIDSKVPIVVVPGEHAVHASAPGKVDWESSVSAVGTALRIVDVPPLVDLTTPMPPHIGSAQRTAGAVITVVGGAGLATGIVFGVIASVRESDAAALSTGPSRAAFEDARANAKLFADGATALLVAGGIVAAVGLVVWITSRTRLK